LHHVHHAASRLTAALDGLLDLSRLYAHRREIERVPIHVRFCLERVGDLLRARPQLHLYTLTVDVPQPDLQCVTDPRLLERTLVELVEYVLRRAKPGNCYCLRADPEDTGLVISLVDLAANGHDRLDAEDSDADAFFGSAVAHELGYILGLGISTSTAEGTSRVLRVSVPATM
jgi:K+-sensing histidine kinase KdpD